MDEKYDNFSQFLKTTSDWKAFNELEIYPGALSLKPLKDIRSWIEINNICQFQ